MCATRDGVLILLRTGPIRAPHPSALAGTAFSAWPSHLSNWCLQLTQMILKVKDTSVMLREGGTPGGSNLGSSSVMVAPRPTGPRSLTVTPIGSSQQLRCCENEVKLHDPENLKSDPWPTSRDLSIGTLDHGGSCRYQSVPDLVFKLPHQRTSTPVGRYAPSTPQDAWCVRERGRRACRKP